MMLAPLALAEEFSDISQAEIDKKLNNSRTVQNLVKNATCAGIGMFLNEPSPSAPFVDIQVQQWLTSPLNTNVVRIYELDKSLTNWEFPTNVPVVFFAVTKRQMYADHDAFLIPDAYPPEYCYSITNETEMAKLMFSEVDRSWFRVTRDNGLIYTFATNLWNCMRANPNPTNYYEVLRDAERTISREDSWRVHLDAYKGLSWLFGDASANDLADKLEDPLLSDALKGGIRATLYSKYEWRYVNGIITPP